MSDKKNPAKKHSASATSYDAMLSGVVELLEQALADVCSGAAGSSPYWYGEMKEGGDNLSPPLK